MSEAAPTVRLLLAGSVSHRSGGWWAMMGGIASEAALFAYLLFSYYYFAVQPHVYPWPPEPMLFQLSLPNTIILLVSSVAAWWAERGTRQGLRLNQIMGLSLAIVLGAIFVAIQLVEWKSRTFAISSHPYGSLYFTITGFHMAHVIVGLLILTALLVWTLLGYFGPWRDAPISLGAMYWHFVDAVWLTVFFSFYITPHLT
jgi:heme/copper-type cytochrome/quinol oxidase subunit 3